MEANEKVLNELAAMAQEDAGEQMKKMLDDAVVVAVDMAAKTIHEAAERDDFWVDLSRCFWKFYSALKERGFSDEQATNIAYKATAMTSMKGAS